ncbi:MAG: DUF3179 domain-containing (seleno)protein [Phycisphaerae bacterium]
MTTMPPPQKQQKLLTFSSGGWVLLISAALTIAAALLVLKPVYDTGFQRAVGNGHDPASYGFDLSNLTIPPNQLVASGKPKDGVHAVPPSLVETWTIPEVLIANKNQYNPFLFSADPVIGVSIGNQSRAYPVRLLNVHEVVNDNLNGTPIAVTWSPLTASAAVFRRPDNTQLGVSGLLYNSNTLIFDRHSDPKLESLWSQISFKAIAGPAVGKSLELIPFQLTTWRNWSTAHPDTNVFRGLRTLEKQYNDAQDPYNLYLATDDVQFPFSPALPPSLAKLPKKTPLLLTTTDNGAHWTATLAKTETTTAPEISALTPATAPNQLHAYAFLFAWYAQHPSDTDYSPLTK